MQLYWSNLLIQCILCSNNNPTQNNISDLQFLCLFYWQELQSHGGLAVQSGFLLATRLRSEECNIRALSVD